MPATKAFLRGLVVVDSVVLYPNFYILNQLSNAVKKISA